jgi:carboxylesterase type B
VWSRCCWSWPPRPPTRALRWVRDNITAFGGGPDKATIAGESAFALLAVSAATQPIFGPVTHMAVPGQLLGPDLLTRRSPLSSAGAAATSAATAPLTDRIFSCPAQEEQRALSRRAPVYAYEFNDQHAPLPPIEGLGVPVGAAHAFELPYLFDIAGWTSRLDPAQLLLSEEMIHYWARFVNTGNTKVDGQPTWPRYSTGAQVLSFVPENTRLIDNFSADHHCARYGMLPN